MFCELPAVVGCISVSCSVMLSHLPVYRCWMRCDCYHFIRYL